MRAIVLVLVCGCDALFHVDGVAVVDASARGDSAPPDVPHDALVQLGMRYVFVTSRLYSGAEVGGQTGADLRCMALRGQLPGRYAAWLSTSTTAARDHIANHSGGPFTLVDSARTVVAMDWTGLTSGMLRNPIDVTEAGATTATSCDVWTNTQRDGSILYPNDPASSCDDWQSATGTVNAIGESLSSFSDWTYNPTCTDSCAVPHRLYCIETD